MYNTWSVCLVQPVAGQLIHWTCWRRWLTGVQPWTCCEGRDHQQMMPDKQGLQICHVFALKKGLQKITLVFLTKIKNCYRFFVYQSIKIGKNEEYTLHNIVVVFFSRKITCSFQNLKMTLCIYILHIKSKLQTAVIAPGPNFQRFALFDCCCFNINVRFLLQN